MLERRRADARLNRALNELLGTGNGADEAAIAIDASETTLRALATLVSSLR